MIGEGDYLEWGLSFLFGVGSALVPVISAEAGAIAAASMDTRFWMVPVILIGVGHTLGKVLLFTGVRRGFRWVMRYRRKSEVVSPPRTRLGRRLAEWSRRLVELLGQPVASGPIMFVSALIGFPPLLVVAVAAALSTTSLRLFAATVLCGRVLRFLIIAFPVAAASN